MSPPFVYMHQVQAVYQNFLGSQEGIVRAVAFGFDEGDVFHVYTAAPKTQLSGYPCASAIQFLSSMPTGDEGFLVAEQARNTMLEREVNFSASQIVIVLLAIEENQLRHRVFISNPEGQFHGCIPDLQR